MFQVEPWLIWERRRWSGGCRTMAPARRWTGAEGKAPAMYCLQWLIPVLLIPKPFFHPSMLYQHAMFVVLYLVGFFIERKPCYICSLVFLAAIALLCFSDPDYCLFWPFCQTAPGGEQCLAASAGAGAGWLRFALASLYLLTRSAHLSLGNDHSIKESPHSPVCWLYFIFMNKTMCSHS